VTGRRRFRVGLRAAAVCSAVVAMTVVLSQQTAGSAFTASSGSSGNSVSTAPVFCSGTGSATFSTNATVQDTWVTQGSPFDSAGGSKSIYIRSQDGANIHALLRFDLTATPIPAGCRVTSATLRMWSTVSVAGRVIQAYRVVPSPQWDQYVVSWNTHPAVTADPPAESTTAAADVWQQWTVTDLVKAQYAHGNNGFLLRDRDEDSGSPVEQRYRSREDGLPPQLTVNWG
jgi:hypothetical protein